MLYGYVRESGNSLSVNKQNHSSSSIGETQAKNQSGISGQTGNTLTIQALQAIQEYGVAEKNIYKSYTRLLSKLKPGDTVVIKCLDCLGASSEDVLTEWQRITKDHQCSITVLDMPLPDTASALNPQFLSELIYDILSYTYNTQKAIRKQRQSEGVKDAKARGVRFGAQSKMNRNEFEKVRVRYRDGELTVTAATEMLGVSRATFRRWVKEYGSG